MALKTSERNMFEKQTIFDGSLTKKEENFIELEEEDDVDISNLKTKFLKTSTPKPVAERPILHSYTENSGIILNVKRKNPDAVNPLTKRIKTD